MACEVQLLQKAFDILSIPKLSLPGRGDREHQARERAIRAMEDEPLWGDLLGEK